MEGKVQPTYHFTHCLLSSLVAQLENLRQRIDRVKQTATEITARLGPISTVIEYGGQNITIAEDLLDASQESLANAKRILDTDGKTALDKARDRSNRFGQQSERMSEIARQSRQLADRHESDTDKIEKLAREAVNTSEEANRLALDAIQTQEDNRVQMQRLQDQLQGTTDLMLRTTKMADEARKQAQKAYNDALDIYTQINGILVPTFESDRMRQEAVDLIGQAERILREAGDLVQKNAETLNSTGWQQQDARDLLNEAQRQQRITDDLLSQVYTSFEKANESIAAGEATLGDAKNTLATLLGFDNMVKESREKANVAIEKIAGIKALIDEALAKTSDAENALQGALNDAIEARDVAIEAQRIAEKASSDADKIREEADTTKTRANRLKSEADVLAGNVDETSNRMKNYETQAANDEKLAKDALERVNQAKTSAYDADKKVSESLGTVKGILSALDGVQDIDSNLLAELERKLEDAERELRNANLDERLSKLKTARGQQQGWIRNYDDLIEKLKRDVQNVNDIRQAIPDACYRREKLEP